LQQLQQQLQRDPWQQGPDPLPQNQALQRAPLQQVQALRQAPFQQNQALQRPLQQQHTAPLQRAAPFQHAAPLQQNQVTYGLQPDPWQQRPDPWQRQRPDPEPPGLQQLQLPVAEEIDESAAAIVDKKCYINQRAYIVDMPDGGKFCKLCDKKADEQHMISTRHVKQLEWEWDRSAPIFLMMVFRKSFNWQFHLGGKVKSLAYYASCLQACLLFSQGLHPRSTTGWPHKTSGTALI
jgi:hypothetical protein